MSIIKFPPNPEDGTIFEMAPGILYKYNAGSNCWKRLKGSDTLSLATPLTSGLMSKEDFNKLQNLIVPPLQTTLQGEECSTAFKSGLIGLYSFDDSIKVKKNLTLTNKTPQGQVEQEEPWNLHQNTAGFDFGVALSELIKEIENRNQLKKVQLQGDQGNKGARGEAGVDKLDTGPVGLEGSVGANSPFDGVLTTESIPFELVDQSANRAIVDITSEEISEDENYLVITRANIGNPDACPALVIPKNFQSAFLVALNTIAGGKLVRNTTITSGDCSLICRICASTIHHVNIEPILQDLDEKFKDRVNRLKASKEELVRAWLLTMVNMFNEQKAALCCALENCQSRKRNERTRQYIETQKIQAAQAEFGLAIDGVEDRKSIDLDHYKDCPIPVSSVANVIVTDNGVTFILDSKIHIVDPRAGNPAQSVTAYLPPGTYVVEITDCCAEVGSYTGRSAITYQARKSIGSGSDVREVVEASTIAFPNLGTFASEAAAKNAYQGLTLTFEHAGGNVTAWILDPNGLVVDNDGFVTLSITDVNDASSGSVPPSSGIVNVYRDNIEINSLLGRVIPFTGGLTAEEHLDYILSTPPARFNIENKAQFFFYNGPDGLSLFFVAGALPGSDNNALASMSINLEITNSNLQLFVLGAGTNADVKQLSPTTFTANVNISGDNSGFVIGPIDDNADYSVSVKDSDFSTMQELVIADVDFNDIDLAQGGSAGIGGPIAVVTATNTAPLFDVTSGVPEEFGGGNERGLQVDNLASGQNVYVTRPVSLDIPTTFTSQAPTIPDTTQSIQAPIVPSQTPPEDPAQTPPEEPGLTTEEKGTTTVVGGDPVVGEEASSLPRGTTGSPQDPCIISSVLSINSPDLQSVRYVFTDKDGTKFFSAFIPTDIELLGSWQFLDFGPPIAIIDPPEEFTASIIASKDLDLTLVQDKLTPGQLLVANSLVGISRLTYVQSIIGSPVDKVADGHAMRDFEIEFDRMRAGSVLFGQVLARVGVPGAITNFLIDGFFVSTPLAALTDTLSFNGVIKRVVADADNGTWSSLGNYFNSLESRAPGDNFFSLARSISQGRITQITPDRGYKSLFSAESPITSISGAFSGEDALLVDDDGGVIVADGAAGQVIEITNAVIPPAGADDQQSNQSVLAASGLSLSTNPVMEFGLPDGTGEPVVIANFNDQWYRFGAPATSTGVRGTQPLQTLAAGPAGNSIAADRDASSRTGNNFTTLYSLDNNVIYTVDPNLGTRTPFFTLPEASFGLKIHPITKDFYWITDDLGTSPRSGTRIKRLQLPPPTTVIETHNDGTFNNGDWDRSFYRRGRLDQKTDEVGHRNSGGNPGAYRSLRNNLSPPGSNPSVIRNVHIKHSASYNPANGAIGSFDFSIDTAIEHNFTSGLEFNVLEVGLALEQDGKIYASSKTAIVTKSNWVSQVILEVTEKDFGLALAGGDIDLAQNPDFSTSGSEIFLGYHDLLTSTKGFASLRHGVDNWNVVVKSGGAAEIFGVFLTASGDSVRSITFGRTVPDSGDRALFALMSLRSGKSSVVEIAQTAPLPPGPPLSSAVPTNSAWTSAVTGGQPVGNADTWFFSRIPPGGGCQMNYKQVQWYERGWRIGACCGALVESGGVWYIVVKRSIGADLSCGGGESPTNACISQYIDAGQGHPAIAWPTTPPEDSPPGGGGDEFLGLPSSGFVNFMKDDTLSASLLNVISSGNAARIIGDPGTEIPFILFPSS
jgi:hypothetical protein